MLLTTFADLIWIAVGILGPFFILVFYPALEKNKLASPIFVIPGMSAVTVLLYGFWGPNLHYTHFLLGGGAFFAVYLSAVYRWGYRSTDAFALSALTILSADQLWQVPIYLYQWSASLSALALGLTSAGFSMMSLPLFAYFLHRGRRPKTSDAGAFVLWTAFFCTGMYATTYPAAAQTEYVLFFLWTAALAMLLRSSRVNKPLTQDEQDLTIPTYHPGSG